MVASRVEVTKNALEMLQDDRGGNGGGAAYESDADYGPQRTGSDTASPGEPVLSSPASRVRGLRLYRSTTDSTDQTSRTHTRSVCRISQDCTRSCRAPM